MRVRRSTLLVSCALALGLAAATTSARAATFVVDALLNSSSGGVGLPSIVLTTGDFFTVSSSTDDLWSAGALPRYSDANGLTGDRFATASDDSGQPVGTHIGANFGLWPQHSISAPFGSLVGELGGVFQELDANFAGNAWGTGTLNLYYWDSNNGDNFGTITFNINTGRGGGVPEPATWSLMIVGLRAMGALLRRRRAGAFA